MTRFVSFLGRFLELRARAFIYALFALVGFQLGVIVNQNMALAAIAQLSEATQGQILRSAK